MLDPSARPGHPRGGGGASGRAGSAPPREAGVRGPSAHRRSGCVSRARSRPGPGVRPAETRPAAAGAEGRRREGGGRGRRKRRRRFSAGSACGRVCRACSRPPAGAEEPAQRRPEIGGRVAPRPAPRRRRQREQRLPPPPGRSSPRPLPLPPWLPAAAAAGGASPRPSPLPAPRGRPGQLRGKGLRLEMREARAGGRARAVAGLGHLLAGAVDAQGREGRSARGRRRREVAPSLRRVPPPGHPALQDCSSCRAGGLRVRAAVGGRGRGTPNLRIWGCSRGTVGVDGGRALGSSLEGDPLASLGPPRRGGAGDPGGAGRASPGPPVSRGPSVGISSEPDWVPSLPPGRLEGA